MVPPAAVPLRATAPPGAANLDVVAFALVGLLGGAHCLGMCGPLVTLYDDQLPDDGRDRGPTAAALRQHALFNLGRTASYAALGVLMGALGGALVDVGGLLAVGDLVRGVAGLVAGSVILAVGLGYVVRGRSEFVGGFVPSSLPVVGDAFAGVTGLLRARVERWARGPEIVGLGAVHGLLPCPLLYPAFLYALAVGSPVRGGLALAALGLGTFPALFAYGTALGAVGAGTRRRLHRALGVAFLVAGTVPVTRGLTALGYPVPGIPLPMPAPLG